MNSVVFRSIAWLQLALSIALAVSVILAYTTYRPVMGQFLNATTASIVSTTKVIALTAETVQAHDLLLDDTQALMRSTRKLLEEFRATALNNANLAPKYAEGMQGVAGLLNTAGSTFSAIGDGLMFSVPTRVELDGIRPTFVLTRPLESQGTAMKRSAGDLKASAAMLQTLSTSLGNDGQNMTKAIVESSNQAIRLLDDSERVLKSIRSQALPNAVSELRSTSAQLESVSSGISMVGRLPVALLFVGLLLAAWCFLNSLSVLHLYSNQGR